MSRAPLVQKLFVWVAFIVGLIAGTLGLAMFGAHYAPPYTYVTEWLVAVHLALAGLTPLAASLLALRRRRAAAFVYLSAAIVVAICGAWELRSRIDWFKDDAFWATGASALFAALGMFWLTAVRRNWPPVLDSARPSWKRKIVGVFVGCLMFLVVMIGAFRLGRKGGSARDCGGASPFARPKGPNHVVFVARAVVIRGWPAASVHVDELSFGIVQEHFWGLPWWDRKIALVGVPLRDGEIYFIDGTRMYGLLTQFLPVVELEPCSRSTQLKYATVDLRILRDGPPRNGVRIIGQVVYFKADNQHGSVGIEVAISGPAGTATVTTDQNGIYDLTGLPPGHYAITANAKTMRGGQTRCETYPDWDLKSGDVWGCSLSID